MPRHHHRLTRLLLPLPLRLIAVDDDGLGVRYMGGIDIAVGILGLLSAQVRPLNSKRRIPTLRSQPPQMYIAHKTDVLGRNGGIGVYRWHTPGLVPC